MQAIVVWAAGLSTIISLITTIWNMVSSGARANARVIAEHGARLDKIERRADRLEQITENAPSREMLHRLELAITKLDGELGQLNERLVPVASIADRMQELLLLQGRDHR
jgi:predicted  nucleic acid-binding Zn-ribbon protein